MATKNYASPAQARLMRARAHGWKPKNARNKLPSRAVANEFVDVKDRGKPKKMQMGGVARGALEEAQRRQATGQTYLPSGTALGDEPIPDEEVGKRGRGLASTVKGAVGRTQLAAKGWHLADGMWYPPQGTLGWQVGEGTPYEIPRAPEGPITLGMMEPGSLAREMYDKYGVIDPTSTRQDLTSRERLAEDPYAHLEADDPARQEYERWDFQRGHRFDQPPPEQGPVGYPEPSARRQDNPYRTQLREHKGRIAEILNPEGNARGGRVEYQGGGLARAAGMRMDPRRMAQMQQAAQRGPQRGQRQMGGQRPMNPQMMAKLRQMQQQRGRGRGMVPPGMRGRMPRTGGMTPSPGMGRPPMARPGGPSGMPGGGQPSPAQDVSRMPGGRAAPFRGMMQKLQSQQRMSPGGNRVGMQDQQGGLSRAMQTQTGRPPISRRAAFPGSRQNQY